MQNLPPGVGFSPMGAPMEFGSRPEPRTIDGTHRFQHWAMACVWGLWIANQEFEYAAQAAQQIWDEVDRLEELLSRFRISSDIHRINSAAQQGSDEWIAIGIDTWECLLLGLAVGDATDGAFDIALAQEIEARRGDDDLIADSAPANWNGPNDRYLQLEDEPPRARLTNSQVQLDLGAIGKGFALDGAAQLLRDWKIEDALIYAGQSTVLALGQASEEMMAASTCASTYMVQNGWSLELRDPQITEYRADDEENSEIGRIFLENRALSGSGQALHGYHIIDPRSGRAASSTRATWAVAPSAALSDACSTAFMNLEIAAIEAFCVQHPDVSALIWENGVWHQAGNAAWQLPDATQGSTIASL